MSPVQTTRYCRELGRGLRYDPHPDGGGTYARLPVWEFLVVTSCAATLAPAALIACLACAACLAAHAAITHYYFPGK